MQPNIKKTNNPVQKMGRRSKQTFPQRRHTNGQNAHEKMLNITDAVKTKMRYHLTLVGQMASIKKSINNKCWRGCGEKVPSNTIGGNVNWYRHYGEYLWRFPKILKIELPYDPVVPLKGIYPEKTII